jgi:betaine-aldehyde dehydrogenase
MGTEVVPDTGRLLPAGASATHLIGGEHRASATGRTRDVLDPGTGTLLASVSEADTADVDAAVRAARTAFDEGSWPRTPVHQRALVLHDVARRLEADEERLATLETLDTGKPLAESRVDIRDVAAVFRHFAAVVATTTGELTPVDAPGLSFTTYEPAGVVGMITPWNYPLLQVSWKIAPALAAGCTFVAKPSELTPFTTAALGDILAAAGVPAGVANIVLGGGEVGAAIAAHPDVDVVSFTGGVSSGRSVARSAADTVKKVALELGGKNPNIVFADVDLPTAVDHALNAAFVHAGQVCSAGSRLLVHDDVHDAFVEEVLERADRIRIGHGMDSAIEMGPVISAPQRDRVHQHVLDAVADGATLALGGVVPDGPGFFYPPTVLTGVTSAMRIARAEVFGPVLTVERFAAEEEVVRTANDTAYGLAGAVWTADLARARRVASSLRLGTVWVNDFHPYFPQAPWGGRKQSGIGRELGRHGLDEFLEPKHVYVNLDPRPTNAFGAGAEAGR